MKSLHGVSWSLPVVDQRAPSGATPRLSVGVAQTLRIVLVVAFYFCVSISLVFLNKWLMEGRHFPYPIFITLYQQLVSCCCILLVSSLWSVVPPLSSLEFRTAWKVLPLTVVYVAMLGFNNLCLRWVEVWYYQVARSLTILYSCALTYFVLGERTSALAMCSCCVVVAGFLLGSLGSGGGSKGEGDTAAKKGSWVARTAGIVFGLLSSLFVALYSVVMKRKMPVVGSNEWVLVNYNTVMSVVLLAPLVVVCGEVGALRDPLLASPRFWLDMTVVGVLGYLVSIAIFMQVKLTSPLTNTISGTAKACLQTLLAIALWGSKVSGLDSLGIILVIGGSFWYSMIRYQEMNAKKLHQQQQSK